MRLILSLPLLFPLVNAVAHPAVTQAAVFDKRQQQVLSTIWGPTLVQGTLSYKLFSCSTGSTLAASGSQWNCCPTSGTCYMATSCSAGTVFVSGTSIVCTSLFSNTASNKCGTDVLFSSTSGTASWNKIVCAGASDVLTDFYFIQSPTSLPSTTSSSSSTTSTTPASSSNNGKSKTPIGAIVGGVVGGIAVLALLVLGVFLLLKRKKSRSTAAAPAAQAEVQQYPPGGHNQKHASYASTYPTSAPGSPPPMYQHNGANQAYYGHSDMGTPPAAAAYPADHKGPLPSPGMTAPAPYQPQYDAPGPAHGAYEMSGSSPTTHRGAVELPVAETSGTR